MTDPSPADPSALTLQDLAARLDDLTRELRRQGRAAVAAQAAAESCLEKLSAAEEANDEDDGGDEREGDAAAEGPGAAQWVRALLPVADALDRMVAQAAAMAERPPPPSHPPRSGLLSIFSRASHGPTEPARDGEIRALAEGVRVLRAQLATALESCGVTSDRRTGVPFDPEVHRVVEARPPRPGERDDTVVEVIRPGYALYGRTIREAEVVAAKGSAPRPRNP